MNAIWKGETVLQENDSFGVLRDLRNYKVVYELDDGCAVERVDSVDADEPSFGASVAQLWVWYVQWVFSFFCLFICFFAWGDRTIIKH